MDSDPDLPSEPTTREAASMPRARLGRRSFWFPAVAITLGIHGAAFFALGVTSGQRAPHQLEPSRMKWVGERADEAIEMRDPKPIFLPTRWNASAREVRALESGGPEEIFGLEPAVTMIAKDATPLGLAAAPQAVQTASDAVRQFPRDYFSAFGQEDAPLYRLPERAAGIEVRVAITGEAVYRTELSLAQLAAAGSDPKRWPLWAPFEVLINVDPTGPVGLPLVATPGSGAELVDAFFRDHLHALLQPHLVLPAGYYRVAIGP
jgi:hypothetical protein